MAKKTTPTDGKSVAKHIAPVILQRIRQDVKTWRKAVNEAELAWYPFRVKMQQLFLDTILNGHVDACMTKRKSMILQKGYDIVDKAGKVNEEWTKWANGAFFNQITNYILDKLAFGYSLVNYDSIAQNTPKNIKIVKRQNVSPDRFNVTNFMYMTMGEQFLQPDNEFYLWTLYFDTNNDTAASNCGYGYLYKVAIYEIFCRNILGYNADYVELFSQPYRVGKTLKTSDDERQEFANSIKEMGSAGYAIIDPSDEIAFLQTATNASGWQSYENLEKRCEQKISKIILGHADALDSTAGKLGSQNGDIKDALKATETADLQVVTDDWNNIVLPKFREAGINIPEGLFVKFRNDKEQEEFRKLEDESNQTTAIIAKTMVEAGMKMDAKYFSERTKIPTTEIVQTPQPSVTALNKLKNFYDGKL